MRMRKISTMYWAACFAVLLFVIYVMMMSDLTARFPNANPVGKSIDENKWSSFESKLQNIEDEIKQHHGVVSEIKSVMQQVFENSEKGYVIKEKSNKKHQEKVQEESSQPLPFKRNSQRNKKVCPTDSKPEVDVQMLSMYEKMSFVDVDGGVWKQGWDITYNVRQWNSTNKLKVFIVPHSHNDPGWIKTFENYYKTQTRAIFQNMVEKLPMNVGRKFIWAEISYLSLWWNNDATEAQKNTFTKLLEDRQIEIVTGGWVMNDEANSHWLAIAQQLTTGHQWLIETFNYLPTNSWSIDPFGYSSSQPYLLNLAGFENSIIQRVHYRVKKELALNKNLEFRWRQLWDGTGETDMFTHMMPFYSYDVPHSCGPDPKICCQFDFKRLPGSGVNCPWGAPPVKIIAKNVRERATLILDQWRKKSQLYRSNVVLFPLGDDFRYDRSNEWTHQCENYESLIDYINNVDEWNAEVQFGTLQDYFQAVHKELRSTSFPVLSGDFFTYADRNQHYWSGYYTTRPFYKRMDRVLVGYVKAAEIISSQVTTSGLVSRLRAVQLRDKLEHARRALALFQHHDGITGTARDEVREDYAKKMHTAIKYCQSTIQQAAYYLLKQPEIADQTQDDIYFDVDDIWRQHDELPTKITIALDIMSTTRRIVLYNALAFQRTEILTVYVNGPNVEVYDDKNPIMSQVSPVVSGDSKLSLSNNKFQLSFPVTVPPLGIATYTVTLRDLLTLNKYTSYAHVSIYNADYISVNLPKMFQIDQPTRRWEEEIRIQSGKSSLVITDSRGLIKEIVTPKGETMSVKMNFVEYISQTGADNHSGAYLFIPPAPATAYKMAEIPEVIVTHGMYKSTIYTALNGNKQDEMIVAISVYDNPSLPQGEVEIVNTFKIGAQNDNIEIAMRFSTEIENDNTFYTDLNGMQMIKRKTLSSLPLQGNFYPLPAAAYIQDARSRLTILTSGPLGVAALEPGQIEIMQDRRLLRDDNRGLNQGILDNVQTRHTFKLIVEHIPSDKEEECRSKQSVPFGQLSLGSHVSQQLLLQPLVPLHYSPRGDSPPPSHRDTKHSAADVVLGSFNAFVKAKHRNSGSAEGSLSGIGATFHRVMLDNCYKDDVISSYYPTGDGDISIDDIMDVEDADIYESSLTYNQLYQKISEPYLQLCPNEIQSIFVVKKPKSAIIYHNVKDDNAI